MTGSTSLRRPLKQRAARWGVAAVALLLSATSAMAHHQPPGYEDVDEFEQAQMVSSGFLHPFTGVDHLLLAFAIGGLAFAAGKKAGITLASAFFGTLALGMVAGRMGMNVPMLEQGLALSVIGAGLLMVFATQKWRAASVAFAVIAGLWHGNAHGAEMAAATPALAYGSALILGTLKISATGAALAALSSRFEAPLGRWAGAALAIAGACIWIA